jgi:uncharacterized protein
MRIRLASLLAAACIAGHPGPSHAAADYRIVTASARGTDAGIAQDLATYVAPGADIDLQWLPSSGSVENVQRLRFEPGVKFAVVQSDVYQRYVDIAARRNASAADVLRPLRVILPLYDADIHFIARADAPWTFVHEIRDARINAGEPASDTALTAATLYRAMFGSDLPDAATTHLPHEAALVRLVNDKSIDVVVIVAGPRARVLADMKPEARRYVKLLKADAQDAATKAALALYAPATVRAASYPSLLQEDQRGLAVKALLVTYAFHFKDTDEHMRRFARALCGNLAMLREKGHPVWREVDLQLPPQRGGWSYYSPTTRELRACAASDRRRTVPERRAPATCTQAQRSAGRCR